MGRKYWEGECVEKGWQIKKENKNQKTYKRKGQQKSAVSQILS